MTEKKRMPAWVWIATVVVLAVCGTTMAVSYFRITDARARTRVSTDLKMLALAYAQYQQAFGYPPRSFEELAKFAREGAMDLPAGAANATVVWGAGMIDLCLDGPPGEVVLGHTPAPNGKDVIVLYADGSVKQETQETFEQAKKATPRPAPKKR